MHDAQSEPNNKFNLLGRYLDGSAYVFYIRCREHVPIHMFVSSSVASRCIYRIPVPARHMILSPGIGSLLRIVQPIVLGHGSIFLEDSDRRMGNADDLFAPMYGNPALRVHSPV